MSFSACDGNNTGSKDSRAEYEDDSEDSCKLKALYAPEFEKMAHEMEDDDR
jgi:hypothetical protein